MKFPRRMTLSWPVWGVHVEQDLGLLEGALPHMDRQPIQLVNINNYMKIESMIVYKLNKRHDKIWIVIIRYTELLPS